MTLNSDNQEPKTYRYRTDCGIDDLDRCPSAATEGSSEDPSSEGDLLLRIESEQNHNVSSQRLLAAEKHKLESLIDKDPICWPKMSELSKWKQLDTANLMNFDMCKGIYNDRIR